jgi:putative FmdB family regulatory protein
MPTYEFRCPEGHEFEKFYRSINSASREEACPVCGKMAERQMSAGGGLVFKGTGFYITDYGKDGKKSSAPSGSDSSSSRTEATPKSDAPSADVKPVRESKPAEPKPVDKPSSSGKKKTSE